MPKNVDKIVQRRSNIHRYCICIVLFTLQFEIHGGELSIVNRPLFLCGLKTKRYEMLHEQSNYMT